MRTKVTPVEFPWGNPIQLGKEVGDEKTEVRGQKSEDRRQRSGDKGRSSDELIEAIYR